MMTSGPPVRTVTKLAENRADFIRRLFAVTVSVGFANQLIRMTWVTDSQFPQKDELPHIIFLVLGLLLVIQSWEGYFVTINNRPLRNFPSILHRHHNCVRIFGPFVRF
jgi:hypothetical protein